MTTRLRKLGRFRPVIPSLEFDEDGFERRLVWMFGSPRTGSTWLMNLLSAQPEVVPVNESGLGQHLVALEAETGADGVPRFVDGNATRADDVNYFFARNYEYSWAPLMRYAILGRLYTQADRMARQRGVSDPWMALKEPNGSHAADWILDRLFHGSRLLFVLRDGRDVVDSVMDGLLHSEWIGQWNPGFRTIEPEQRLHYVRVNSALWVYRTEAVQRAYEGREQGQRFLVRYEELLSDTALHLGRLYEWLQLDVDAGVVEATVREHSFEAVPEASKGQGKIVRAATPGLWRENLTAEEQAEMERIMGPKLRELGYGAG